MNTHKNHLGSLASRLNYGEDTLAEIIDNATRYYRPFHIVVEKPDGKKKTRHIDNPYKKLPLRALQMAIKKELLNSQSKNLDLSLVGGIKKRSMISHLEPHIGKQTVVCMDLSNCFPNIDSGRVLRMWRDELGYSDDLAKLLTKATTYRGYLPQGAPTSSMICNFALNQMAKEIRELLASNGLSYTQYIDDICFSGDDNVARRMIGEVHRITYSYGQRINKAKTEIMDTKHRQQMMGITVNARTKVNVTYVNSVARRINTEIQAGYINNGAKLSIVGQILHVKKYDEKAASHLERLLNAKVIGVYDGNLEKNRGEIKTCWQYRFNRTRGLKCRHLVT